MLRTHFSSRPRRWVIWDERSRQYLRFATGEKIGDRRKAYLTPHKDNASVLTNATDFEWIKFRYGLKPFEQFLSLERL